MPRPRTPLARAQIEGRHLQHPERFAQRREPQGLGPVGEPPDWLNDNAKTAWREIASEVPWLNSSQRGLLEIAATVRGRLISGQEVGVNALNLLRQCMGSMGATPADASKIPLPVDDPDDDLDEFFN